MKKLILLMEWVSILGLIGCGIWVFLFTPLEINQGFSQKIMYIHVPSVITTYIAFFVVFAFFATLCLDNGSTRIENLAKINQDMGRIRF